MVVALLSPRVPRSASTFSQLPMVNVVSVEVSSFATPRTILKRVPFVPPYQSFGYYFLKLLLLPCSHPALHQLATLSSPEIAPIFRTAILIMPQSSELESI